jgi:hypothetical protein
MVDKTRLIETVTERLEKLPIGHYLDVRTYKRNRSVLIVKMSEADLLIIEDGFFKERFHIKSGKLGKLLAPLLRKEFPRSHKIRVYVMGKFTEEAKNTRRKIL